VAGGHNGVCSRWFGLLDIGVDGRRTMMGISGNGWTMLHRWQNIIVLCHDLAVFVLFRTAIWAKNLMIHWFVWFDQTLWSANTVWRTLALLCPRYVYMLMLDVLSLATIIETNKKILFYWQNTTLYWLLNNIKNRFSDLIRSKVWKSRTWIGWIMWCDPGIMFFGWAS
jgi:hypothetical protein